MAGFRNCSKAEILGKRINVFFPLKNIVEAHGILEKVQGKELVSGGLCGLISFIEKPESSNMPGQNLISPLENTTVNPPQERGLFKKPFFHCIGEKANISDDIEISVWEKFLLITAFSGVGAVTRVPIGLIRSIPETRKLLYDALKEVIQLANAQGVKLDHISL